MLPPIKHHFSCIFFSATLFLLYLPKINQHVVAVFQIEWMHAYVVHASRCVANFSAGDGFLRDVIVLLDPCNGGLVICLTKPAAELTQLDICCTCAHNRLVVLEPLRVGVASCWQVQSENDCLECG